MRSIEKGMNVPDDLKYNENHLWIRMIDDITAFCGITDFAQYNLGEIVYSEFVSNVINSELETNHKIAIIESTKDSIDVTCPLTGKIIEINRNIEDSPELLNEDPYGEGWIFKIEFEDVASTEDLLEPDEYLELIMPDEVFDDLDD